MCGIAGIVSSQKQDVITEMIDIMAHRGPDDEGYYQDDAVALGQRRLSIIDLEGGKQPISNEFDDLYLICNGEIYNSPDLRKILIQSGHSFKTTTDVEVILHLYEEHDTDCVKYLQGMFAFAIWDKKRQTLFLARDHMGQKPLFFYHNDGVFAFASEVKGILASGLVKPEIELNGLWHYVSLRFLPNQYSLFKKIQKLPAASYLFLENGNVKVEKYWELDFNFKISGNESDIIEKAKSGDYDSIENDTGFFYRPRNWDIILSGMGAFDETNSNEANKVSVNTYPDYLDYLNTKIHS